MIPNSTLLDVSDFFVPHRILTSPVSIHAPTWGATPKKFFTNSEEMFQSTLPHGERPMRTRTTHHRTRFNPRSRMGSDLLVLTMVPDEFCFNPRSRMGSDLKDIYTNSLIQVSTHAPAWGATRTK